MSQGIFATKNDQRFISSVWNLSAPFSLQSDPWLLKLACGTWIVTSLKGKEPELVREVEQYQLANCNAQFGFYGVQLLAVQP